MTIRQQGGVFGRHPKFSSVEVDGPTQLDGLVTVNTAGEQKITLQTSGVTYGNLLVDTNDLVIGTGVAGVKFYDFASAVAPANSTTGSLVNNALDLGSASFSWRSAYIGTSVVMANGAGIDFSATAGTGTSELFNDYEEGTFTPTISTTGTALSSVTYDPVTGGKYTKVGNLVHVQGIVRTDAITVGVATGSVQISSLPFTSASNTGSTADGSSGLLLQYSASFLGENPTAAVVGSSSTNAILYYRNTADGGSVGLQVSDIGTGANANFFYFSGTYVAA